MKNHKGISALFWVAALYDGILGIIFLVFGMSLFEWLAITPPNHIGYIQFPAALLIIFGLIFAAIARQPVAYRHFIMYGILLKVAYCSVVFGHWAIGGIPWIWKPFAILDALFIVLFIWAMMRLKQD